MTVTHAGRTYRLNTEAELVNFLLWAMRASRRAA